MNDSASSQANAAGHRELPRRGLSGLAEPQRGRDAVAREVRWRDPWFTLGYLDHNRSKDYYGPTWPEPLPVWPFLAIVLDVRCAPFEDQARVAH